MAKRKGSAGKPATTRTVVKEVQAAPQVFESASIPADAPKIPAGTISRKDQMRETARRKRQQQRWTMIGVGAVIVLLIGVAVVISIIRNQPVVGETTYPTQGNL